jgi:hypothetical protein
VSLQAWCVDKPSSSVLKRPKYTPLGMYARQNMWALAWLDGGLLLVAGTGGGVVQNHLIGYTIETFLVEEA